MKNIQEVIDDIKKSVENFSKTFTDLKIPQEIDEKFQQLLDLNQQFDYITSQIKNSDAIITDIESKLKSTTVEKNKDKFKLLKQSCSLLEQEIDQIKKEIKSNHEHYQLIYQKLAIEKENLQNELNGLYKLDKKIDEVMMLKNHHQHHSVDCIQVSSTSATSSISDRRVEITVNVKPTNGRNGQINIATNKRGRGRGRGLSQRRTAPSTPSPNIILTRSRARNMRRRSSEIRVLVYSENNKKKPNK